MISFQWEFTDMLNKHFEEVLLTSGTSRLVKNLSQYGVSHLLFSKN